MGTVTLFAGRGGEGKSTFALHIIAECNAGTLDGDLAGTPVDALIISHEDDWGTVMVPRLKAAGADPERVIRLAVEMTVDETTSETVPMFPIDVQLIRDAIRQTGARVILIDPITSTVAGDLHKVETIRAAMNPLAAVAAEFDVAIIGILHFNKGSGNLSDKISGSHAWRDIARSTVTFAEDPDSGKRVIEWDKSNYSAERGSSLEFDLESVTIATDDGELTTVARVINLGATDVKVSDIINREPEDGERSESDEAADWLVGYLEEEGGSAFRVDVLKAAKAQHFSDKVLRRAREKKGIVITRRGVPGKGAAQSMWALPALVPRSGPLVPTHESGHEWARAGHERDDQPEPEPLDWEAVE